MAAAKATLSSNANALALQNQLKKKEAMIVKLQAQLAEAKDEAMAAAKATLSSNANALALQNQLEEKEAMIEKLQAQLADAEDEDIQGTPMFNVSPFDPTAHTKTVDRAMPSIPSIDDYSVTVNDANNPLGRGTFGKVLLATKNDDEFAIKCTKLSSLSSKESEYFINMEITILTHLGQRSDSKFNPNIVRLFDDYKTFNHIYLVLELHRGSNLLTFIKTGPPLKEQLFLRWSEMLLNVVVFLQENNVGHLDIKPTNIMIQAPSSVAEPPSIVLIDFGCSHLFKKGERIERKCGTPNYMAPEVTVSVFCDSIENDCIRQFLTTYHFLHVYSLAKGIPLQQTTFLLE